MVSSEPSDGDGLSWGRLRMQAGHVAAIHDGALGNEAKKALAVDRVASAKDFPSRSKAESRIRGVGSNINGGGGARPETRLGPVLEREFERLSTIADRQLRPVPSAPFYSVSQFFMTDYPVILMPSRYKMNRWTGRVHIHCAANLSEPCGLSFLPESLLAASSFDSDSPTILLVSGLNHEEMSKRLELPPALLSNDSALQVAVMFSQQVTTSSMFQSLS
jgi:hypothetical protein